MTVLLLEVVDSFEVAVKVIANIVPRITGIMDILVCPEIR